MHQVLAEAVLRALAIVLSTDTNASDGTILARSKHFQGLSHRVLKHLKRSQHDGTGTNHPETVQLQTFLTCDSA